MENLKSKIWHCLGLMSGTSLDGVDICYASFQDGNPYQFTILKSASIAYPEAWKTRLSQAFNEKPENLKELDLEYGTYLGSLVKNFLQDKSINQVDLIASHGHTIFHKPEAGFTLQIGNGGKIASATGIKVICDFRTQDVELGGQGAPLVPIGDELLFSSYDACLNLGGFANVSYKDGSERLAFDICPANIVLNHYVKDLGLDFDDKGGMASTGQIHMQLLEALNALEFYSLKAPKSLGFEWVNDLVLPLIDAYALESADILRTYTEHIAWQIAEQLKGREKILVTGGGAYNDFLIGRLEYKLGQKITLPNNDLIDFKEALIFAFLGLLKNMGQVNVLASVTGARENHSSGVVF